MSAAEDPLVSEELLDAILQSSAHGIFLVEESGKIRMANPKAHEMFGYQQPELTGFSVEELLPLKLTESHRKHRAAYFKNPHPRPMGVGMDLSGQRKDGSQFPVEISLSSVSGSGEVLAIAFVSDVSIRKNLQEQLILAQRMEAMGQLAGGIAHDFNNMLTVILACNSFMLDKLSPADPIRAHAEDALRACERSRALVRQILEFSSRQMIKFEPVDLNDRVEEVATLLHRTAGEHINLIVSLEEDLPLISGDPTQVEQIIANLAINSRDAMPNGGDLTIETSAVTLDDNYVQGHFGVNPGDYVRLTVSDSGKGMDSETIGRIFDPFFTTKDKSVATGLGLSTVYGIVKRHKGDIWVYSEIGHGTTIRVYFPVLEAQPPSRGQSAEALEGGEGAETILVVEDEEAVRQVIVKMLERNGYKVFSVADADQAIRFSRKYSGQIDLVLCDMQLVRGTGLDVARALVEHRPEVSVLIMSGYATAASGDDQGGLALAGFLSKPFNQEELTHTVYKALRKEPS